MAISGSLSASQRPLAALRPTRTPVNEPGPLTTAMASSDCRVRPAPLARSRIAGTRRSEAVRPGRVALATIAAGVGEGDAAGGAAGVDEEKGHRGHSVRASGIRWRRYPPSPLPPVSCGEDVWNERVSRTWLPQKYDSRWVTRKISRINDLARSTRGISQDSRASDGACLRRLPIVLSIAGGP